MADYGFQSWDANGVPNNYGIKPVSVQGFAELASGQKSGSWVINPPAGFVLRFYHVINLSTNSAGMGSGRRRVTVSGSVINVTAAGDTEYAADTFQAARAFLIFTIEKP